MSGIQDSVGDFCGSEYFLLLDTDLKDSAELLLSSWCDHIGPEATHTNIQTGLSHVSDLDVDLSCKRNFPRLLEAYLNFVSDSGLDPGADAWIPLVLDVQDDYLARFRGDGTVKGETFKRAFKPVGRNDPCPCGSGKKFKKCCIDVLT